MQILEAVNIALGYCDLAFVNGLDDATPSAEAASRIWEASYRAFLEEHDWDFALAVVRPARYADRVEPWAYAYGLPDDCVRVLDVTEAEAMRHYGRSGTVLRTVAYGVQFSPAHRRPVLGAASHPVLLHYVSAAIGLQDLPPGAALAFAARLGMELAMALKHDGARAELLFNLYQSRVLQAKGFDGRARGPVSLDNCGYDDAREAGV